MYKQTKYVSKSPDQNGFVAYTEEENQIWHDLYVRQMKTIEDRACKEYIEGLHILGLTKDKIPQLPDVNQALSKATGWAVAPVNALIQFEEFFDLLAHRKFPAATFIRTREDFDYIKEPDIFHELYGHCPMLTHPVYAGFMQKYGELALKATHKERVLLARLYWFTVEFGLINTLEGLRIYGGGILSSHTETIYATDSEVPRRKKLNSLDAFRTPYRIDILQPVYFVIDSFEELYGLIQEDLIAKIHESWTLGEFPPLFEKSK